MPTIKQIGKVKVQIFPDDHNPPHFHVVTPNHEALILLSNFKLLAGRIDRKSLEAALDWASSNKELLQNEWTRLNER